MLEIQRLRGIKYIFLKILNGHENIDPSKNVLIKACKIARGHNFMVVKEQNRLHVRKTVNE